MNNNIFWIVVLAVKDGQLENLKKLMGEMVDSTNINEPDTINYEWFLSDDEKTCHIYERYKDSAAVMKHVTAFGENFAERFMENVDLVKFTLYGNPETDAKEALAGFTPVYMSPSLGFAR